MQETFRQIFYTISKWTDVSAKIEYNLDGGVVS